MLRAVLADLQTQPGLGEAWAQLDCRAQKEIRLTWRRLLLQTLKSKEVAA